MMTTLHPETRKQAYTYEGLIATYYRGLVHTHRVGPGLEGPHAQPHFEL
jgi:hypothetical protein